MSDLSVRNLFFSSGGGAEGALDQKLTEDAAEMVALKSDIGEQLPKLPWKTVEKEMGAKIGEVLDVGIDDVFFAAWQKYQGLREYADPAKHPAEETALVPLARHTVRSEFSPHVDLLIKDVAIGSIELDVQLALELEGVVLRVQGGKIWEVCAGSCRVSGSLKGVFTTRAGSKELLALEKESPKLQLPGAVHLANGITIPAPGAQAAESN